MKKCCAVKGADVKLSKDGMVAAGGCDAADGDTKAATRVLW